jgi:hypothetical protein
MKSRRAYGAEGVSVPSSLRGMKQMSEASK